MKFFLNKCCFLVLVYFFGYVVYKVVSQESDLFIRNQRLVNGLRSGRFEKNRIKRRVNQSLSKKNDMFMYFKPHASIRDIKSEQKKNSVNSVWDPNPTGKTFNGSGEDSMLLFTLSHGEIFQLNDLNKINGTMEDVILPNELNRTTPHVHGTISNKTLPKHFSLFKAGLVTSFILTIFTEFGDRTFFITGLLALQLPYATVFWGSWSALVCQTILSTLIGFSFHALPLSVSSSKYFLFPFDDYAAAVFLFVFGVQHLLKLGQCQFASFPKTCNESDIRDTHSDHSVLYSFPTKNGACPPGSQCSYKRLPSLESPSLLIADSPAVSELRSIKSLNVHRKSSFHLTHLKENIVDLAYSPTVINFQPLSDKTTYPGELGTSLSPLIEKNQEILEAEKIVYEFQPMTLNLSGVNALIKVFWTVFFAEFADKSMFSTIALATTQNPFAVCLGGAAAHFILTLLATLTGTLCEKYISENLIHFVGALLFLAFALLTTLEGLNRQGVFLWPFVNGMNSLQHFFNFDHSKQL